MKKRLFLCLLALLSALLFCACAREGKPLFYQTEHDHVWSASYDVAPTEGNVVSEQVRYCKICHAEQTHPKQ